MALTWKKGNRIIFGKGPAPNYKNPYLWPKDQGFHKKYSFNSESNPWFTTSGVKLSFRYGVAMVHGPLYYFWTCIFFPIFSGLQRRSGTFPSVQCPQDAGRKAENGHEHSRACSEFAGTGSSSKAPYDLPVFRTGRSACVVLNTASLRQTTCKVMHCRASQGPVSHCTLQQSLSKTRMTDRIPVTHPHRDHRTQGAERGRILSRERKEQSMFSLTCWCWHKKKVCQAGISQRKQTNNSVLSPSFPSRWELYATHSHRPFVQKCYTTTRILNALLGLSQQTWKEKNFQGYSFYIKCTDILQRYFLSCLTIVRKIILSKHKISLILLYRKTIYYFYFTTLSASKAQLLWQVWSPQLEGTDWVCRVSSDRQLPNKAQEPPPPPAADLRYTFCCTPSRRSASLRVRMSQRQPKSQWRDDASAFTSY